MNRSLRNRMIYNKDARNPYGSEGSYVSSRSPYRRDRAREMRRDMNDYRYDNIYNEDYGETQYRDYGDYNYPYDNRNRNYYPFEIYGGVDMRGYDYRRDYANDYGERLTREELHHWEKKLLDKIDEKDKAMFNKEMVLKKAKEIGIKFDDFNEDEFYIATLMVLTDFCKTLGTSNVDMYIKLAKDWLCDDDVKMQYGDKLAIYFDTIVMGK